MTIIKWQYPQIGLEIKHDYTGNRLYGFVIQVYKCQRKEITVSVSEQLAPLQTFTFCKMLIVKYLVVLFISGYLANQYICVFNIVWQKNPDATNIIKIFVGHYSKMAAKELKLQFP